MAILDQIIDYLTRPSRWHIKTSGGFSMSTVLGVSGGTEQLVIERNGRRGNLMYTSIQGGFSVGQNQGFGGSVLSMPSADIFNKIYLGPTMRRDLDLDDFTGGARSVYIGITSGLGASYGMYVFGTAALAVSGATTAIPQLSLVTALGLANAIAILDASNVGTPSAGITFGLGSVIAG